MKKTLLLLSLLGTSLACFAQGGTSLTKDETINYLNKKAKEVIGHYRTIEYDDKTGSSKNYYFNNSVSKSGDNLLFEQARRNYRDGAIDYAYYPEDYIEQTHENLFNPIHILSIEKASNFVAGEPIGTIKITLKSTTAQLTVKSFSPTKRVTNTQHKHYWKTYDLEESVARRYNNSTNVVYLSYLQSDDTNFNKIKKALEHLRDLYKAEDDPFSN